MESDSTFCPTHDAFVVKRTSACNRKSMIFKEPDRADSSTAQVAHSATTEYLISYRLFVNKKFLTRAHKFGGLANRLLRQGPVKLAWVQAGA